MDRVSLDALRRDLQTLEDSLNERERALEQRQQSARELNADVTNSRRSLDIALASKSSSQRDLRESSRRRQVLEDEKRSNAGAAAYHQTREDYVSQLMKGDEKRQALDGEIKNIGAQVNDLKEKRSDAQKRLTVVRLMSMLDDLQTSLNAKVNAAGDDVEEARAQELLKAIQELSRERERALMLLTKKEVEVTKTVELKKKRIKELRLESDRNRSIIHNGNDAEVHGVVERIQKERRILMSDIQRLEETNDQLERILLDTRYSATGATSDRKAALAADDTLGTSHDLEEEKHQLRRRIIAANAEQHRYEAKTEAIQKRIEEEADQYNEKMSAMLKEILVYEEENKKIEKDNVALKALCDSIANSLES